MLRVLVVLLLLPSAVLAQPSLLGPRLGDTVDAYEWAYFRLVPQVDDFAQARLSQDGGWVRATVERDSGEAVVVRIPQEVAAVIRDLVADYESFAETQRAYESALSRVPELAEHMRPPQPRGALGRLSPRVYDVTVSTGVRMRFSVLRMERDTAYVWMEDRPFTLADLDGIRAVPVAAIERIESKLDAPASVGRVIGSASIATVGSGLAMGTGVPDESRDVAAVTVLSLIQGGLVLAAGRSDAALDLPDRIEDPARVAALFTRDQVIAQPAPELRRYIDAGRVPVLDLPAASAIDRPEPRRPPRRSVRVMVTGAGRNGLNSSTVIGTYASGFGTRLDLRGTRVSGLRYQVDVAVPVSARLAAGVEGGLALRERADGFQPSVASQSAVGYVEYGLIMPNFLAQRPFGASLAAGLGVGRQSLAMPIDLPPPVAGGVPVDEVPTSYDAESLGLAWMGRASASYHINTRVALQVSATLRGLPAPEIDAVEFVSPRPGSQLVLFEWDAIRPPSAFAEVSVGTRVSL